MRELLKKGNKIKLKEKKRDSIMRKWSRQIVRESIRENNEPRCG